MLPLGMFAILFAATAWVGDMQASYQRRLQQRHAEDVGHQACRRLQVLIEAQLWMFMVVARYWAIGEGAEATTEDFEEIATPLLQELSGYHALGVRPGASAGGPRRLRAPRARPRRPPRGSRPRPCVPPHRSRRADRWGRHAEVGRGQWNPSEPCAPRSMEGESMGDTLPILSLALVWALPVAGTGCWDLDAPAQPAEWSDGAGPVQESSEEPDDALFANEGAYHEMALYLEAEGTRRYGGSTSTSRRRSVVSRSPSAASGCWSTCARSTLSRPSTNGSWNRS